MTKNEINLLIKKHEDAIELLENIESYERQKEDLEYSKNGFGGEILGKAYYDKKIKAVERLINILENKYKKLL
jgi:predicted RNase H-like nuclease (RuvC/YqgF family)